MDVDGVVNHSLNTYSGSFITADINQDPPRDRGITMDTSNVEPIIVNTLDSSLRSPIDYKSQFKAYHLVSGSSILFNITDPDFINGAAGNVDIKILYLDDTDGTINVYYDSTSGEKLGASYSILASNGNWASKTIQVNDGRFNSATQDIRIEVLGASADPVFAHVSVESDSFLGLGDSGTDVVPPAVPTGLVATSGIGSVSLDWSDNGEPDLHAYGVYRSDTGVVPYTHIQDVFTSEYVDIGVDNGTKYYYVVTALDASNNESGISDQDSALPPDLTEDDKIDLEDLAMIAAGWLTTYNMDALSAIAENWLVY